MASSGRSQIIDYTFQHVNNLLCGHSEGTTPEQINQILTSRLDKLKSFSEPYSKPSDAAKKRVDGGSITLEDGAVVSVEDSDKDLVLAISKKLDIDQVDAFVLLRSFLYNEGLPATPEVDGDSSLTEELLEAIMPFYYSERLHIMRVIIALLRAQDNPEDPFHDVASTMLPKVVGDPDEFVKKAVSEYQRKIKLAVPESMLSSPRTASQWAKQLAKEQLVTVEVLFWSLWKYIPCNAPIVVQVYQAAYKTEFGYDQENGSFLLDEEGLQLQRDIASLWILVTIEALNMESVADHQVELSSHTNNAGPLSASPTSILEVHKLVMSRTQPGYVCTFLAWALFLDGISAGAARMKEQLPEAYNEVLREIGSKCNDPYHKREDELQFAMVAGSLKAETGLFPFLLNFLTHSPVLVSSAAWKVESVVTTPNAAAYRSILKGLIIALIEFQPVEFIPDFDGLVEVWVALFGGSEQSYVVGLCRQFWDYDWRKSTARRAVLEVARTRFPVQFRPLVRLLRAMTGSGSSSGTAEGTGSGSTSSSISLQQTLDFDVSEDAHMCTAYVFHYFLALPTYTQIIPATVRTGPGALYDRVLDRPASSSAAGGAAYTNLRPVKLPGTTVLPPKSIARLLCPDSSTDPVVVAWQHSHSGWKVVVEVLVEYVQGRYNSSSRRARRRQESAQTARGDAAPVCLDLADIGLEGFSGQEEENIAEALYLILSVIQHNPTQAEALMDSLEDGGSVTGSLEQDTSATPPDLVQVVFMIMEDALSRAHTSRGGQPSPLVAPSLFVLSALLSIPKYANRVWLYLRSSSLIFGSTRSATFESALLQAERMSGSYTMTLALVRLVGSLLQEALASFVVTHAQQPRLQAVKDEVLLRALRFVHVNIWVEHLSWRYSRLGDRFEIGRHIVSIYGRALESNTVFATNDTFSHLSHYVTEMLVTQVTTSTINPLVQMIATGRLLLQHLTGLRRFADVRQFGGFLEGCLHLARLMLSAKQASPVAGQMSLLEQLLCTDISPGNIAVRTRASRLNPVDVMTEYVKERALGNGIPLEAIRVLSTLCTSLSACSPTPASIVGLLTDAHSTMSTFVRILQHPYDDINLRNEIWAFAAIIVNKQTALASLLVAGQFRIPTVPSGNTKIKAIEGPDKDKAGNESQPTKIKSAFEAACETLESWEELWEANPQLLRSAMRFLEVVWQHGFEHRATLKTKQGDTRFWKHLSGIMWNELGPTPDYISSNILEADGRSDLHEAVSTHAYRAAVKGHALRIIGLDVSMHVHADGLGAKKCPSFTAIEATLRVDEQVLDSMAEAVSNAYDTELHERLKATMETTFVPLQTTSLRSTERSDSQEYGDDYLLSVPLLRDILEYTVNEEGMSAPDAEALRDLVHSANLNLSLAYTQLHLIDSWCYLLQQVKGYLRSDMTVRKVLLSAMSSVAQDIAMERRDGDMMAAVHAGRLSLLVAVIEVVWFDCIKTGADVSTFVALMRHLGNIVTHETFPPAHSFLGTVATPFHRALLQVCYFCGRTAVQIVRDSLATKADQRLTIGQTLTSILLMVIDALRINMDAASTRNDVDLDGDMQLLVAAFEQCTRPSLPVSTHLWLSKCQEADLILVSLKLLTQIDIIGFSDLPLLRSKGQPLYAPHVLLFHRALATVPSAAERVASENLVAAYSNTNLTTIISAGAVDVTLPDISGERSPTHKAYCMMLSNIIGMIGSLVSPQHVAESQIPGLIQLYGSQLSRTLSWNNEEPLTLPFLEELEFTVELFYLVAEGSPASTHKDGPLSSALRAFRNHALELIQHLNYALTHPKHLAGLLEPVTAEERNQIERETADVAVNSLHELVDASKRPTVVRVIRRLFSISSRLFSTLITLSNAESILTSNPDEWILSEALVVPHSKVTVGEPASIGTLLELGNCAHETLRFLVNQKPAIAPGVKANQAIFSVQDTKIDTRITRQVLETVLLYATTQLVMWLVKYDEEQPADMDQDESQQDIPMHKLDGMSVVTSMPTKERKLRRKSLTLADRLRRGMTGEMTADLQALITKSMPVVAKSNDILGGDCIDLTRILDNFMSSRMSVS